MKIKVVSDGTPRNTEVTNEDTGEALGMVAEVGFSIKASGSGDVWVRFVNTRVEVVGDADPLMAAAGALMVTRQHLFEVLDEHGVISQYGSPLVNG